MTHANATNDEFTRTQAHLTSISIQQLLYDRQLQRALNLDAVYQAPLLHPPELIKTFQYTREEQTAQGNS